MDDKEKFAKDNINLIYRFLDKYHIRYKQDEILDILYIGYAKALNLWDKDKGEFSTIAFACMQKEYLRYYRLNNMQKRDSSVEVVSLNTPIGEDGDEELIDFVASDDNIENTIYNKILFEYLDKVSVEFLTEWQRTVFVEHYKNNLTLKDIAKKYNVEYKTVHSVNRTAIAKLRKYFNSSDDFMLPPPSIEEMITDIINHS